MNANIPPIRLIDRRARAFAHQLIDLAPDGMVMIIRQPSRTMEQNSKFHAICGALAASPVEWNNRPRMKWEWKGLLVSGVSICLHEAGEMGEGLEGEPVVLRESTSEFGVEKMSNLIEYSTSYCVARGVELREAP